MDAGLHVIIRPRGGDFLYSDLECEVMLRDIEEARRIGVDGLVFGCLTADGQVDVKRMKDLMAAAGGLPVTFHRAFDMCCDPLQALRDVRALGCRRILTSGQEATAEAGIPLLKRLVEASEGVIIMPGCGVNASNVARIARETGAHEFHLSARVAVEGGMRFRNSRVSMGGTVQVAEYGRDVTSQEKVEAVIGKLLR